MKRLLSLLAISLIATNVGCTLCSSCDDYTYGAHGGLWERSDLTHGRVGSAFSPQGYSSPEGYSVPEGETAAEDNPEWVVPEAPPIVPPAEGEAPRRDTEERSLLET